MFKGKNNAALKAFCLPCLSFLPILYHSSLCCAVYLLLLHHQFSCSHQDLDAQSTHAARADKREFISGKNSIASTVLF